MSMPLDVDLGLRIHRMLGMGHKQIHIARFLGVTAGTVRRYQRWTPPKVVTVTYGDEIVVDFTEEEFARLQVLKREKRLERERMERVYGED